MCKGGKKKQLSGGNQKWSMKLMKLQCHRLIQLSFNSHGKVMLLFQHYFLPKYFLEIVTSLPVDLLHQGTACIVNSEASGGLEAR